MADFSRRDPERSYPFENDASSWRSSMTFDGGEAVDDSDPVAGDPNYVQGRLTRAQENTDADAAAEVVHVYAYDHLGNVRVKQVEIEGLAGTKTAVYDHDLAGRVTRLVYPDGAQARYAYDCAGRLSRVGDANGNTLAAYTHNAAGNIATHVAGDNVAGGTEGAEGAAIATGTYAYNPREWVTDIDYAGKFSSELTYDLAGNVTRQDYSHGTAASKTADYAYDALYRITGFDLTGGTGRDYAYDRSGNLTSMVTGSNRLTYNYSGTSTPNRLDSTAVGSATTSYAYNPNGWMTARGDASLTYDYRGLTTGYGSARYLLDPDRRRVKKTVGTAVTYYLRGPGGNVLAEYTGQTQSARYVYAGSRRIARIAGSSASYYLAEHLGSTRSLVDDEGAVTAAYDYWPYGKVLATNGTDTTHFRFTGHERDAESGLDYMLARSYAYDVGRFLRPDPMQDEYPGISPYAYAANNPLKYVDPDGNSHHEPNDRPVIDREQPGTLLNTVRERIANAVDDLPGTIKAESERTFEAAGRSLIDFAEEGIELNITLSDIVSKGANYGMLAGAGGTIAGLATGQVPLAATSYSFMGTMSTVGGIADVSKTVSLFADAYFFDGSMKKAIEQSKLTLGNYITSKIIGASSNKAIKQMSRPVP